MCRDRVVEVNIEKVKKPLVHCKVRLSLSDLKKSKKVLIFPERFLFDIQPLDKESEKYELTNWSCGVITGGQYILRRGSLVWDYGFIVHKLTGCLGIDGPEGISFASALAVNKLLYGIEPDLKVESERWVEKKCYFVE